jgi:uncharacterized protein YcaQ
MTTYPVTALRTLALYTQNLHKPNKSDPQPSADDIYNLVDRIGCVQIDTLQMVRRSHYIVPWSRLGVYDPGIFDALVDSPDRRLFEGWLKAVCIIPLTEYRYQLPHQRKVREHPSKQSLVWLSDPQNVALAQSVLERIRHEGALRTSDFDGDGHKRHGWWDWKPAKNALEHLFAWGDLMIAGREKFQRRYDLTSRVLPTWVDTREPTAAERDGFWVERSIKALGACLPRHAGYSLWMGVNRSQPMVKSLLEAGTILPIQGKLFNGKVSELIIHRDNLPLLEQAADGSLKAFRTTFLSPFDNLLWAARRDEMFWGFHQALECYLPASKRVYGYFCLPILHKDRLVGRFDPKLERKTGLLRLKALYLEPGEKPDEELIQDTAFAMRDFMAFHDASDLLIETSQPLAFGKKLKRAL